MENSKGTPLGTGFTTSPEESISQPGRDPVLDLMRQRGIPLTRENYLALSRPDAEGPLSPEEEMELPEEFRLPSTQA